MLSCFTLWGLTEIKCVLGCLTKIKVCSVQFTGRGISSVVVMPSRRCRDIMKNIYSSLPMETYYLQPYIIFSVFSLVCSIYQSNLNRTTLHKTLERFHDYLTDCIDHFLQTVQQNQTLELTRSSENLCYFKPKSFSTKVLQILW